MLVVCPLLLELTATLELDVEDDFDSRKEDLPGLRASLGHVGPQGLAKVLHEARECELKGNSGCDTG